MKLPKVVLVNTVKQGAQGRSRDSCREKLEVGMISDVHTLLNWGVSSHVAVLEMETLVSNNSMVTVCRLHPDIHCHHVIPTLKPFKFTMETTVTPPHTHCNGRKGLGTFLAMPCSERELKCHVTIINKA